MKKKNVDQKVIRAISIGLSAVMAFTPITAMAEEGATVSGGDAESSQEETTVKSEQSVESRENEEQVADKVEEVKEDYSETAEKEKDNLSDAEAGDYAEVVGNVSDILEDVKDLNDKNDEAADKKQQYEEKLDTAEDAVKKAEEAVGEGENSVGEKVDSANQVTGELAENAKDAAEDAKTAESKTDAEDAAKKAEDAADAAELVDAAAQEQLNQVQQGVAEAEEAVEAASNAYQAAKSTAEDAQKELASLLEENGLTGLEDIYTTDEAGNLVLSDKLDGNVAAAIQAALEICEAAKRELDSAEADLAQNKQSFAGKIQELQEEIKNLEGQSYWDATKTMNEYLIRYAMAEDEDIDSDSITFGKWYVNNATSKGYENENYVSVTFRQSKKDAEGNYVLDAEGNRVYEEVTKYYNYHKEDKTVNSKNEEKTIFVVEKKQETATKTVTDKEAYTENYLENEKGSRLESEEDEEGNLSYKIVKSDSDGNKTGEKVDSKVVTVAKGEDKASQAVLGKEIQQTSDIREEDVLQKETTGNAANGSTTEKKLVENTGNVTYEYTTVTVVDEYGTKNEKRDSEEYYYKSDAKKYIQNAFGQENTIVVISYNQEIDGKLFHSTEHKLTYSSYEEFLKNYDSDVKGLKEGTLWTYKVTVYDVLTDYDNILASHEEEAVIETVTADIANTTNTTTTTVTKGSGEKVKGDKKSSVSSADDDVRNKLVASYEEQYEGYTVSMGSYNGWDGKGTFTLTSPDGLITIEVSYNIDTKLSGLGFKSSVTHDYKKTEMTKASSEETVNEVVSRKTYLANVFTNGSIDHAAITHEEEYTYWKENEDALIRESSVDFTEYQEYLEAREEAEKKNTAAKTLYEKLLTALNRLTDLKAAESVDNSRLLAAQNRVDSLKNAYEKASGEAEEATKNAEEARKAAEEARNAAENWQGNEDGGNGGESGNGSGSESGNGGESGNGSGSASGNGGESGTDSEAGTDEDAEDDGDNDEIGNGAGTTVTTPILAAGNVQTANTVTNAQAAQQTSVQEQVTVIEEEQTPLAAAPESAEKTETTATAVAEDAITIADETAPLADIVVDSQKEKISWWWLLIIVVLGATGREMYKKHMQKKELAENGREKEN